MDLLKRLYQFWMSEENSNRGSCAQALLGAGVMVMHKVLLTGDSPLDVADAVLACKILPDLIAYDTPCQLWPHIKSKQEGMLENNGILPRLPPSTSQFPGQQNQADAYAPGLAVGSDVATQAIGRVYLPKLAHLGSHSSYPMPPRFHVWHRNVRGHPPKK